MRTMPYEIRQKLLKDIQVKGTEAEPNLRVVVTQSTTHTLLSEIIQKDIPADYGDVAVRQLEGESSPSLAYALCIDTGIAILYDRRFPTYIEKPWNYVWTLGAATETAIEFNGTWKIDAGKQWYYLQTELTPYIFFVNGGTLYVQQWNNAETRIPLAESVAQISVCRGWQSSDDPLFDQGLIIGYLKSGSVYYRALCLQESGELLWETERQVTELGSGNETLCVFRTNDFRVGFITEKNGAFQYVLSSRTYAGQSVRPESVYSQIEELCFLKTIPILYIEGSDDSQNTIGSSIPQSDGYIGLFKEFPTFEVIKTARISNIEYLLTFSHELSQRLPLTGFLTIIPDVSIGTAPAVISAILVGNTIRVTADKAVSFYQQVQINLNTYSSLRFIGNGTSWLLVPNFTAIFPPEPLLADDSAVYALPMIGTLTNTRIQYSDNKYNENFTLGIAYSCTLATAQVGPSPI